jgi:hypothetical protein
MNAQTFFCVYEGKELTGAICPDCQRFDCAVTAEELAEINA